jgi:hypothetical protein
MNRIHISLLVITLFLALCPIALASTKTSTNWYVDGVNGNDANDCRTSQTACKTIGHAISSLASSGDSIIVAPATYTENLSIGISLNIIGSGANTTIIDGGSVNSVIENSGNQVTLSNITIQNGLSVYGGGIRNFGTLTINNSTVNGNRAWQVCQTCQTGHGGGIYNSGQMTINSSTISGNSASCGRICSSYGGGIYNANTGSSLAINNSTITGNAAALHGPGYGGGIYNYGGLVTISNSTISGNSALPGGMGGNIYNYVGGKATLQNSIVGPPQTSGNCYGTITSHGYNLSSDGTCNFVSVGDLENHAPLLGPLQNNGGTTSTMALLPGSPAIDAGNPAGCTDGQGNLLKTDQRGMPRPDEGTLGCDMGAYEAQDPL